MESLVLSCSFSPCRDPADHRPKATFIAPLSRAEARELVQSMNDSEFEEWKNGVQKGVNEGDWANLAAHRTCIVRIREEYLM
jgi:hypothetical protein